MEEVIRPEDFVFIVRSRDCKRTSENSVNGASTGLLDRYRSDGDMEFLPHRRKASEVLRAE